MTEKDNRAQEYTLKELHRIKPREEKSWNKDSLIYVSCANYARTALLANLDSVLQESSERLYKKTEEEMIYEAKQFYKDYLKSIQDFRAHLQ